MFLTVFDAHGGVSQKQGSAATTKAGAARPLKIGVASMITPVDTVKYYQDLIDYIGETIKQPVQMVHRRTYSEMDELLEKGEVKIAFICSAPYVRDRERFGVELLVAPSVHGVAEYHSYIIVREDSPVNFISQLKGKSFAFVDPKSNSGRLYPIYLLKKLNAPDNFFKRVVYSYSHNKSIELVAKKIVDGAAVDSLVYDYMMKKGSPYTKTTKIIKRSPSFGIPPVVTTRNLPPFLREKLRSAFLNMHTTAKGKAILDAMLVDRFVLVKDSDYDSIRTMERVLAPELGSEEKTKDGRQAIHFGVIPRDNPRLLYERYQPLLDYLAENTPYSYELVLKKNYEETVDAIGSGELDLALLGPLTYLEAHKKYKAVSILKPKVADGGAIYRSMVIKKKGSPVKTLQDLKGRSMAFAAVKSTVGNLIPRYLLANSGIHLSELSHYANFDYHSSVVKAVLRGQFDAGAVRDSVARKYAKLGIEVVATSEAIPTGPLVAGPKVSYQVIESVRNALLKLDPKNAAHQKVLKYLDDELKGGFTVTSDQDYDDIRSKINAVPQGCGLGCHPRIRF